LILGSYRFILLALSDALARFDQKPTSKSYGLNSYPKKDQGQGILGATPSKPEDDKGETIEKQPPKASMQEKTSSIKCFKCLGRGHIASFLTLESPLHVLRFL